MNFASEPFTRAEMIGVRPSMVTGRTAKVRSLHSAWSTGADANASVDSTKHVGTRLTASPPVPQESAPVIRLLRVQDLLHGIQMSARKAFALEPLTPRAL